MTGENSENPGSWGGSQSPGAPERRDAAIEALAEAIRQASRAGILVGAEDLRGALTGMEDMEETEGVDVLLAETLARNDDLAALESVTGRTLYHAPGLLSRTYAAILDRKAFPLILMAEEIRRNSLEYPRPVPLEMFQAEPFALTPEQTAAALAAMAEDPAYRDITFTTTSTGAVYMFSLRHLERPYAAFLAERADVGLAENP